MVFCFHTIVWVRYLVHNSQRCVPARKQSGRVTKTCHPDYYLGALDSRSSSWLCCLSQIPRTQCIKKSSVAASPQQWLLSRHVDIPVTIHGSLRLPHLHLELLTGILAGGMGRNNWRLCRGV